MATQLMNTQLENAISIFNSSLQTDPTHKRHRYEAADMTDEFISLIPDTLRTSYVSITARQCKKCHFIDHVVIRGLNCSNLEKLPVKGKVSPNSYNSDKIKYWYSSQHHEHTVSHIVSHEIIFNEEKQYFVIRYVVSTVCEDCQRDLSPDFGAFLVLIHPNVPLTEKEFKLVGQTLNKEFADIDTLSIVAPYDGEDDFADRDDEDALNCIAAQRSFIDQIKERLDGLVIGSVYIRLGKEDEPSEAYIERLSIQQYLSLQNTNETN